MTTPNNSIFVTATLSLLAIMLVGCASSATRVEKDYGNSVHAMQVQQTMDPMTIINVDTSVIETTDGQRMDNALSVYRETVGEPAKTTAPLVLDISGSGN
jgi:hypothetical protein